MVTNERQARELHMHVKERGMKKWQLGAAKSMPTPVLKRGMDKWMLAMTLAQLPKSRL